jgi:hypothetical protein
MGCLWSGCFVLYTPCKASAAVRHEGFQYGMLSKRDGGGFWWLGGAAEGHVDHVVYLVLILVTSLAQKYSKNRVRAPVKKLPAGSTLRLSCLLAAWTAIDPTFCKNSSTANTARGKLRFDNVKRLDYSQDFWKRRSEDCGPRQKDCSK